MNPEPVIAIFDIGKTNKKLRLFDREYRLREGYQFTLPETLDADGENCEDIGALSKWILENFREICCKKEYLVCAVNIAAYGATLVYLDEAGNVLAPVTSYFKKYPASLQEEVYSRYGGADRVALETASPVLGSLNAGMQLYRTKRENPLLYGKIKYALHLPQYLSFLLSGNSISEITSIGCHTQLWDFRKERYHKWVTGEGLDKKLAPLRSATQSSRILHRGMPLETGTGLHDSSAALIPYQTCWSDPFILISTGTWCISLNPFSRAPLTNSELQRDCLCYLNYMGNPVKASRLFAGGEHLLQTNRIATHFLCDADFYNEVRFNPELFPAPGQPPPSRSAIPDISVFGKRSLSNFRSAGEAYHFLLWDLIQQQEIATRLIMEDSRQPRIYVDGGFSTNQVFMQLLANCFPECRVYAASLPNATALGAALVLHGAWNPLPIGTPVDGFRLYQPGNIPE